MSEVMVSIFVPTYNHEKYIKQALDSILMQKTQYTYEVFVGEDCSTDNTRQILREWEREHPGKFTILYRDENMNKKEIYNSLDLKLRCRGKYIIGLEGDDFWTDPEKLEKQITFLETHPEYYAVAHNCIVVGEDSLPNGETYPECKDAEYSLRHFASDVMPGQFTTLLSRNYMTDENLDNALICSRIGPGDRNIYLSIASYGRIYCMQESMSAYRHITSGGSSYSANVKYNYASEEKSLRSRLEFAQKLGYREAIYYSRLAYVKHAFHSIIKKRANTSTVFSDMKIIPNWYCFLPEIVKNDMARIFFRRGAIFK